jgi:hypothetical protein
VTRWWLLLALVLLSCGAALPPRIELPLEIPAAAPTPTPPPEQRAILRQLAAKDAAMRSGDHSSLGELLDPNAPQAFRDSQAALLVSASRRSPPPFIDRTVLATRERLGLLEAELLERDDQGRARQRRVWFSGPLDALRQTEPPTADLGPERVDEEARFRFIYRDLDAPQVAVARALGERWLQTYATRLGDGYAPRRTIEVRFAPTQESWPQGLPALASAAVSRGVFYVLSSTAMLTASGDAAAFTDVVVGHELAHVLLDGRGRRVGGFLLSEGIPLWLTEDTRATELARLVRRGELWPLDQLLRGPQDDAEFFAAYAQASSFVHFVAGRFGSRAPLELWEASAQAPSFDAAARLALGRSAAELHRDWLAVAAAGPEEERQPIQTFFDAALPQ